MTKKLYTKQEIQKSIKDFEKKYNEYESVVNDIPNINSNKDLINVVIWLEDLLKVLKK